MWVWLSDPRTTWILCLQPIKRSQRIHWDKCQYCCCLCTHCLEVDRGHNPFHSFPCCGVYGRRREANGPAMTLTQVACQVAQLRPGYAFVTGKSCFFFFIAIDPLQTLYLEMRLEGHSFCITYGHGTHLAKAPLCLSRS